MFSEARVILSTGVETGRGRECMMSLVTVNNKNIFK